MTFKKATDRLFSRVDHEDLAKALSVSVALIRQARLSPDAIAHRSPPPDWEEAVLRLAEERVSHFRKLVEEIRGASGRTLAARNKAGRSTKARAWD